LGSCYQFECKKCGYQAEVAGGKDCGMVAVVKTMICSQCHELIDVLIGHHGKEGRSGDPEYDKDLGHCPLCQGIDIVSWGRARPCPKCSNKMKKGPGVLLWD